MARHVIGWVLMGILLALLGGCGGSDSDSGGATPTAAYLPLAVGNEWRYDVMDYQSTTTAQSRRRHPSPRAWGQQVGTAQVASEEVITISGTTPIGGSTWYVAEVTFVGGTTTDQDYLRHTPTGLLWKAATSEPGVYWLRTPVAVGTKWVDSFDARLSYEITSVADTVSTPAGAFTGCVAVEELFRETGYPDEVAVTWFAPGVGQVRYERHVGPDLDYLSVLKSYVFPPPSS